MSGGGGATIAIPSVMPPAALLARVKTVDAEFLKLGEERRAVLAHEQSVNPHRQYTTSDQAILSAQFFG